MSDLNDDIEESKLILHKAFNGEQLHQSKISKIHSVLHNVQQILQRMEILTEKLENTDLSV